MKILFVISLIYLAMVQGYTLHSSENSEKPDGVNTQRVKVYTNGGTANGAPCVFPFLYKDRTYVSCTKDDHSTYWCSTSYDFAKDQKWGNCLPVVYTTNGTANGAPCVFPFLYKGRHYDSCTIDDHSTYWCSTTYDFGKDKSWGNCLGVVPTNGGTAKGALCVFPFLYKRRTYDSCTKDDHSTYWCSTTYDFAKEKKWGNCLPVVYTANGTANGAPCVFPFLYKGRHYESCTKDDHSTYWCSTTYDFGKDKSWGNCLGVVPTTAGTANDAPCVFPFLYKGRTYNSCTNDGHSTYWCSTTYDFAKEKKWGNCPSVGKK